MTPETKPSVHTEIQTLEKRINFNKGMAWLFVVIGAVTGIVGFCVFYHDAKDSSALEKMSFMGSYFQGSVGSLWSLAGLMFIYVAFLGQKQQLLLQREAMEQQKVQFDQQQFDKEAESKQQAQELEHQRQQFRMQQESIIETRIIG